jgi:autotransporter-associated beta strand protein
MQTPNIIRPAFPLLAVAAIFLLPASPSITLAESDNQHPPSNWMLSPINSDWNTAANWTPASVPDTVAERAVFDVSTITNVSGGATVHDITFLPGASQFTINGTFTFKLGGIINNSGVVQTFNGLFRFQNRATAGNSLNVFMGTVGFYGHRFGGESSAGSASFIFNPGGGYFFEAMADSPSFYVSGGSATASRSTLYFDHSFAGSPTIENGGGTAAGKEGGLVGFIKSNIGSGTIVNQGGAGSGSHGARLVFYKSSAGSATLIANGGPGPATGAKILFLYPVTGSTSRIEVFGNGNFDISPADFLTNRVGSIEGNGLIFLGASPLAVGGNNLDTTFAGVISDAGGIEQGSGGSLTKEGTGTLILSNANDYSGGSVITAGSLLVTNTTGSGTGNGSVQVNAGVLGGDGTIAGAVTLGTGNGIGATVSPGLGDREIGTLAIQQALTFASDGIFDFDVDTTAVEADGIVAKGVTINGASFSFSDVGISTLPVGTTFTLINNIGATPISGSFTNLADGSIFTVNSNKFRANYQGGDGNDLTLTVVP